MGNRQKILLKNGYIADGTGKKGWKGSLLISGERIKDMTAGEILSAETDSDCAVVDCTGKVIAPGFIDAHSHNDWYLPSRDAELFTDPFLRQGITTFVGGNCGFGVGGIRQNTMFMDSLCNNPFKSSALKIEWSTMGEYFDLLSRSGIPANFANLAGHGSARTSIKGYEPSSLTGEQRKELLELLEKAMDDGAKGVSLGLQYEPGMFSPMDELREVAKLVKKKDKLLTVHARASSALSGSYPIKPFGIPHHILALKEMTELARETGVRLQYSHLIFVGEKTWKTFEETMHLLDQAIADGVDIKFDIYAYTCGASIISVILPEWFMARIPEAFDSSADLTKLKLQLTVIKKLLGFGYEDIQIAYIDHPELKAFNGRFIPDIAKELRLSLFETYILFAKSSGGKARVMQYKFSNPQMIEELMKHPAAIFMTDSWVERAGIQNPASYGCFPRFLQMAREKKVLSMEETVFRMTKAAADRFEIKDRGMLKTGNAADITVFDWNTVRDNTGPQKTDAPPTGIEHVFLNGSWVLKDGKLHERERAGVLLK